MTQSEIDRIKEEYTQNFVFNQELGSKFFNDCDMADDVLEWFEQKLKEAYTKGYNDCRHTYLKAQGYNIKREQLGG